MEKVGVKILGLTSDGASTNRTMWTTLGINSKMENFNNSFRNPFDSKRKVYVFSDAPHLLKTVRNRLHNKKILRVRHEIKSFFNKKKTPDLLQLYLSYKINNHIIYICLNPSR